MLQRATPSIRMSGTVPYQVPNWHPGVHGKSRRTRANKAASTIHDREGSKAEIKGDENDERGVLFSTGRTNGNLENRWNYF